MKRWNQSFRVTLKIRIWTKTCQISYSKMTQFSIIPQQLKLGEQLLFKSASKATESTSSRKWFQAGVCVLIKIFGRAGGIAVQGLHFTFGFKVIALSMKPKGQAAATATDSHPWSHQSPPRQGTDGHPPECPVEPQGSLITVRAYASVTTTARKWSLFHFWFLDLIQVYLNCRP